MELPLLVSFIVLSLCIVIIQLHIISYRLRKLEDESEKNRSAMSVLLNQIDQISSHVGV